ncbi:MAG: MFS transporter [Sphingomonadales bacterium]|nr:MFS transporter [Sphingomonadales bacterium]
MHAGPQAQVGFILFIIRLLDAVTDPLIGFAVDRSKFRQQHKPWIFIAFPIFICSLSLLLFPIQSLIGPVYLFLTLMLTYLAYTIALIAHQAWGAALATSPAHLSRLFGLREIGVVFGILGTFAMTALAEQFSGGALSVKAAAAGGFIIAMIIVATVITGLFAPDPNRNTNQVHEPYSKHRAYLLSPRFLGLCAAALLYNFGLVAGSVVSYFVADRLFGMGGRFALGQVAYFAAAWVGMICWIRMAARLGDGRTLIIGCGYTVAVFASLLLWVQVGSAFAFFAYMVLSGIAFGVGPYLVRALTGALANRHEAGSGDCVRGISYSVVTFFDKLGTGMAAGVALPLVAWLGFDPAKTLTQAGRTALLGTAVAFPVLAFGLIALITWLVGLGVRDDARAGSAR